MLTHIYPDAIATRFPTALAALKLSEEALEKSDLMFFVRDDGTLFCESHDERTAWHFNGAKWVEITWPLRRDI